MDLDKLLAKQDLCINDSPPPCVAKCPIHVDVKGFIEQIQKGDFGKAYEIIEKRMPMARIIARICDHPCQDYCVREDKGGSISIRDLERAAIEYGANTKKRKMPLPAINKSIAIIGGGISGLTCAIELKKKGYKLVIFEKGNLLGGRLREMLGQELPQDILDTEIESIKSSGIQLQLKTPISELDLEELRTKFDAVFIGTSQWKKNHIIDDKTLATEIGGVFRGGRIASKSPSIILSVSSGKIAANSIDRYVKKVSLTGQRAGEGPYETDLEVDLGGIKSEPRVISSSLVFTKGEAREEANRCILCECGKCYKACPHLRYEKLYPKAYIRTINQNERVIMGDRYANATINSCMTCGLCLSVCPTGLDMGEIIRDTRKSMVERDKMPVSAHDFALKDMEFNTSKYFNLLKHQPGLDTSKYLYFPGCQLCGSYPQYIDKSYQYLIDNLEGGVGLYLNCCGAPAEWAGREDLFQASVDRINSSWKSLGQPTIILACSTCYYIFKKYLPNMELVTLWEIFNEKGLPQISHKEGNRKLMVHDSCTARDYPSIYHGIRNIMTQLDYDIIEPEYTKEKTQCCGYGGLSYFANREFSNFATDERIQGEEDYLAYCAMCRDLFVSRGKKTLHILDLIFGEDKDGLSSKKGPTLSERRNNRLKLKKSILNRFWKEKMDLKEEYSHLNLIIDGDIIEMMEDRLILEADIKKVIGQGEKNRDIFINSENGHRLAFRRILNVTYWVEYTKTGDSYKLITVYSHRMDVQGD